MSIDFSRTLPPGIRGCFFIAALAGSSTPFAQAFPAVIDLASPETVELALTAHSRWNHAVALSLMPAISMTMASVDPTARCSFRRGWRVQLWV